MQPTHLDDRRDQVLIGQTPALEAPHFGQLPPLTEGAYRYVLGVDGLYVQARTAALDLCLPLAPDLALPYGPVTPEVTFRHGRPDVALMRRMVRRAVEDAPDEWAGGVMLDGDRYRLIEPPVASRSGGHIRYDRTGLPTERLVIDVHSHGHGDSYFSATDDDSDREGIYIAVVLGRCQATEAVVARTRVCIHGHLIPLTTNIWPELATPETAGATAAAS